MTLNDLIESLKYGELKHFNFGSNDKGGITEIHYPEIVSHLNLGLSVLYSKFFLAKDFVILRQDETINRYHLNTNYAQSNTDSSEPIKYLIDSAAVPFEDTVVQIIAIQDSENGSIVINDYDDEESIMTPTITSLYVPNPSTDTDLKIWYQKGHYKLVPKEEDTDLKQEIHIPVALQSVLELFIAYRALANSPQEEMLQKSQITQARYSAAIQDAMNSGIYIQENLDNLKLDKNFWA